MNTPLSLRNYKEWTHCIAQRCPIPLTLPHVEARLPALLDPGDLTAQRFIGSWGDDYLARVIEWARFACAELTGNPR